jgi:hypothetical protein
VLRVTSPEATALELVGYSDQCGGLDNVASVLTELIDRLEALKLLAAARLCPIVWVQRLGYLLDFAKHEDLGDVLVASFPFVANGKAHAVGETAGFVKLIANPTTRTLVGGHLVGPDVSELLPELTLAAGAGTTIDDLIHNVHAHPTLSESLQEAFHGLAGHMINF